MFKKSPKEPQHDIFGSIPSMLTGSAVRKYNDEKHWHNQFRQEVVHRIDETYYKALFNDTMGAPNAPIRLLIGMMILKEAFGWSDAQLFEQCQFNLLTRSALGLVNMNDSLPAESTYYLLRKRIYEYHRQSGEDLLEKTFTQITREQVKQFNVNGSTIRMDSKLIGSNIAYFTRYEIIHQALCGFYKTLDKKSRYRLSFPVKRQIDQLMNEEPGKTVYHSNKQELQDRLQPMGLLIHKVLQVHKGNTGELYQLLERVFDEQYKVNDDQQVELRPKEEIASDSVQSPHDPDSAFRNKDGQKIKGYSANITETNSDDNLNLITSVIVDPANTPDTEFVQPAIDQTRQVTDQDIDKAYLDGAYQSPDHDEFCQDIDMVYTGISGNPSRYDLEMTSQGLLVTDTHTGEHIQARLAKKIKNSKQDNWYIDTDKGRRYFTPEHIRSSHLRRQMNQRPKEETRKRNNVEATIFQFCFPLRNNKTRYRGQFKHQIWAYCRCLWINLVRIINLLKQPCQRTVKVMEMYAKNPPLNELLSSRRLFCRNFSIRLPVSILIFSFINFLVLIIVPF
jgi:hypothetical protein